MQITTTSFFLFGERGTVVLHKIFINVKTLINVEEITGLYFLHH